MNLKQKTSLYVFWRPAYSTLNILDKRRDIKEQKHNMYANYVNTTRKRKNLLEQ